MPHEPLTTVETAALLILLAEGGSVPNVRLTRDHHCDLRKDRREKLEKLGLIDVEWSPRLTLTLSDRGWAYCRKELATGAAPPRSGAIGGALYAVLRRWDRYLTARQCSLADFVTASDASAAAGGAADPAAIPLVGGASVEARLLEAYRAIAPRDGDLVSLADLRDKLADLSRAEVDAALRRLHRRRVVTLVPEANQKMLDARTRAAALVLGNQPKHAIATGAS